MKKAFVVLAVLGGLAATAVVGAVLALNVGIGTGHIPDTRVLRADEIRAPVAEAVASVVALRPGERIRFYYSSGFLDHREDMNIVTDQRVISYQSLSDGAAELFEADYGDIVDCSVESPGGLLEDALVLITTVDDYEYDFYLLLSTERGRDDDAIAYIRQRIAEEATEPTEADGAGDGGADWSRETRGSGP